MTRIRWTLLITGALLLAVAALIIYPIVEHARWRADYEARQRPLTVQSADDLARRIVPGWTRAESLGLVVAVDRAYQLPAHDAIFRIEKAWLTGRVGYLLVTTEMAGPDYLVLNDGFALPSSGLGLRRWQEGIEPALGLSPVGMHAILVIDNPNQRTDHEVLTVNLRWWAYANANEGYNMQGRGFHDYTIEMPWRELHLTEPAPTVLELDQSGEWLGRSLSLEQLTVEVGRMTLTGQMYLPEEETKPYLFTTLRLGEVERRQREFEAEPTDQPGVFRFTAQYDGPEVWPAPVQLLVDSIHFQTDQVLEWQIPFHYTEGPRPDHLLPDPKPTVRFYDQNLPVIYTWTEGASVELVEVEKEAPYVLAGLGSSGRHPQGSPGFEVISPAGEIIREMGGGGGTIWDRYRFRFGPIRLGYDHRNGVSPRWGADLPESFREAETLTLRYYYPGGRMVIDEIWDLN